jgi:predicted kinase
MAERFDVVDVEVDREHRGPIDPGRRIERQEWVTAYRAAHARLEAALRTGKSAVFDAVSYRRSHRHRVERIARRFGLPMTVIYLDVTPEEALRRREANARTPARPHVPDEDFAEIARGMQPPGDDERVLRYRPKESLDLWIEREIIPLLEEATE